MTRTVVTATQDTSLHELIDEMVSHGVSGIPIVDTSSRLVGIVTEADLMTSLHLGELIAARSRCSVICCGATNGDGKQKPRD